MPHHAALDIIVTAVNERVPRAQISPGHFGISAKLGRRRVRGSLDPCESRSWAIVIACSEDNHGHVPFRLTTRLAYGARQFPRVA